MNSGLPSSSASSGFNWPLIVLLFLIAALNYCDRTAVVAVFPLFRKDLGMSDLGFAAVGSVFLWSYGVCSPIAGSLADRRSRSLLVLVSLPAWSLITLWASLCHSTAEFLATRVLLGMAESIYLPAAVGLLADAHVQWRRGTAIGFHTAGLSFGAISGATLAGYLGERFGWRLTFTLMGFAGLVLTVIAIPILTKPKTRRLGRTMNRRSVSAGWKRIAHVPSYWLLLIQSMLASVFVWIFMNWLPLYFKQTFSMSLAGAGLSGTLFLESPGIFAVALGGLLSDRVAKRNSARRMLLQGGCYLLAAPVLLIFSMRPVLSITAAAIFGFSILRSIALANENPLLCDLLASPYRSTAIGLMNTANCLAGGVGIFATGLLKKEHGLGDVFASISVLVLCVASVNFIGYLFVLPRDLKQVEPYETSSHVTH